MLNFIRSIKLTPISKLLLALLMLLSGIGFSLQYSAGNGDLSVYAYSYLIKILIGFIGLFIIYKINLKIIFLLADLLYFGSIFLLLLVDFMGITRLGAQRWLNLGIFVVQPSEIVKISIIIMLAKHFHKHSLDQIGSIRYFVPPLLYTIIPFILVAIQPDLGTAIIIAFIACTLLFMAGLKLKYYFMILGMVLILAPIFWSMLHSYQKNRILTFIDPSRDPRGTGYHINQSKIAIGSGGFTGKGLLVGSQGQLNFLPEKHTDFIFTLFAEEFGFLGSITLISMFFTIIILCAMMASSCEYAFGRFLITGVSTMFFSYVFVNIGMVSGILPIVGAPLPLISYGGTSILTTLGSFGLVLNIENNKHYQ